LLTTPSTVPPEIEHTLIWSRVPVFHPDIIHPLIDARVQQDGLCGFTGSTDTIECLPPLESCLPALADWGITLEKLIRSPNGSDEEEAMVQNAGREVRGFVERRWREKQWETAWFVNPPVSLLNAPFLPCLDIDFLLMQRLQSIPGLAHIHVFARKKTPEEEAAWGD
jgi:hypothetical protein